MLATTTCAEAARGQQQVWTGGRDSRYASYPDDSDEVVARGVIGDGTGAPSKD